MGPDLFLHGLESNPVSSLQTEEPWTAACQASLSITNSQSLLKLMSIEWVMPSNSPFRAEQGILPGESQGRGSLVGCHLWGHTQSDMTEVT